MDDFESKLTLNHLSLVEKKKIGGDGYGLERRENREKDKLWLLLIKNKIINLHVYSFY